MLIEQVDCLDLEPLERALDGLLDVLRPAIQARRTRPRIAATQVEPELGGDHHLLAEGSEGFAHKLFVHERAVNLGGVEERDAAFHGGTEQRGHLLLVFGRAVRKAHSHAAQAEGRDFQVALSELLFIVSPSRLFGDYRILGTVHWIEWQLPCHPYFPAFQGATVHLPPQRLNRAEF